MSCAAPRLIHHPSPLFFPSTHSLPYEPFSPAEGRLLLRGFSLAPPPSGDWHNKIQSTLLGGRSLEEIAWYHTAQQQMDGMDTATMNARNETIETMKLMMAQAPMAGSPPSFTPEVGSTPFLSFPPANFPRQSLFSAVYICVIIIIIIIILSMHESWIQR